MKVFLRHDFKFSITFTYPNDNKLIQKTERGERILSHAWEELSIEGDWEFIDQKTLLILSVGPNDPATKEYQERTTENYQDWILTGEGHIATLTLNHPDTLNSITTETLKELADISTVLRHRKNVWAVILQGDGDNFSSGMDLSMINSILDTSEEAFRKDLLIHQQCLEDFESLEKPTIAKLRGYCIGGSLLLALCCDFCIASERTIFSLPEVRLGIPILWGTNRITRVVGEASAKEMILLDKRFKATERMAHGLVHKVVPPEELDTAVASLADRFMNLPPRTVGIAKRIINHRHDLLMRESQNQELDTLTELLISPALREAIVSYTHKKRPRFTGV